MALFYLPLPLRRLMTIQQRPRPEPLGRAQPFLLLLSWEGVSAPLPSTRPSLRYTSHLWLRSALLQTLRANAQPLAMSPGPPLGLAGLHLCTRKRRLSCRRVLRSKSEVPTPRQIHRNNNSQLCF